MSDSGTSPRFVRPLVSANRGSGRNVVQRALPLAALRLQPNEIVPPDTPPPSSPSASEFSASDSSEVGRHSFDSAISEPAFVLERELVTVPTQVSQTTTKGKQIFQHNLRNSVLDDTIAEETNSPDRPAFGLRSGPNVRIIEEDEYEDIEDVTSLRLRSNMLALHREAQHVIGESQDIFPDTPRSASVLKTWQPPTEIIDIARFIMNSQESFRSRPNSLASIASVQTPPLSPASSYNISLGSPERDVPPTRPASVVIKVSPPKPTQTRLLLQPKPLNEPSAARVSPAKAALASKSPARNQRNSRFGLIEKPDQRRLDYFDYTAGRLEGKIAPDTSPSMLEAPGEVSKSLVCISRFAVKVLIL